MLRLNDRERLLDPNHTKSLFSAIEEEAANRGLHVQFERDTATYETMILVSGPAEAVRGFEQQDRLERGDSTELVVADVDQQAGSVRLLVSSPE